MRMNFSSSICSFLATFSWYTFSSSEHPSAYQIHFFWNISFAIFFEYRARRWIVKSQTRHFRRTQSMFLRQEIEIEWSEKKRIVPSAISQNQLLTQSHSDIEKANNFRLLMNKVEEELTNMIFKFRKFTKTFACNLCWVSETRTFVSVTNYNQQMKAHFLLSTMKNSWFSPWMAREFPYASLTCTILPYSSVVLP